MNKQLAGVLATLEDADTVRTTCPFCGGGTSRESSFVATREGDSFFWKCFRASCGVSGQQGPGKVVRTTQPRKRVIKGYEGELEPLSEAWCLYLHKAVGFTPWHIEKAGALYAPAEHRVAFPIYSPMGFRRGWMLRSYTLEPKALTFPEKDEPRLSYYRGPRVSDPLVVVEDIPSAVRASKYTNAVALLGTGCTFDDAAEMSAHFDKVVWALDKDACNISLKWMFKFGGLFRENSVLMLQEDMKDMEEEALEALLQEADSG